MQGARTPGKPRVVKAPAWMLALGALGGLALGVVACRSRHADASNPPSDAALASSSPAASDAAAATAADELAADVRSRIDTARIRLGADARIDVENGVFVFVAGPTDGTASDKVWDASLALARKSLAALLNGRFATLPDRAEAFYIFPSQAPYDAFCRRLHGGPCASPWAVHETASHAAYVNQGPGLTTLTHELVHPILEADFPHAPAWINEGIASLYEAPVFPRSGEIEGVTNWRRKDLFDALASREGRAGVRLDALFGMSDDDFRAHGDDPSASNVHFAMARYACLWLEGRKQLWPFYHAWRDGAADDPSGEKAFARVVGKTPAEANAEWLRWVRTQ